MWKQFPIVLDECCASIFRFTLKMEAMDYVVSHQKDGILQYYSKCFCFSQQVTGCPGMLLLHPLYCVCLCMCNCVNLSVTTFGQVKKVSYKIV